MAGWRLRRLFAFGAVVAACSAVAWPAVRDAAAGIRIFHNVPYFDPRPLEDQLQILRRGHELLAIDAWSNGVAMVEIGIEEQVRWSGVRGGVALVVTDRRALAASAIGPNWVERAFAIRETEPELVVLGDRVALIVTNMRVLGFEATSASWSERSLGPRERVLSAAAGTNVAVAVTKSRALGVAAAAGGIFEQDLGIHEDVESLSVHGSFATIETRYRLLTFRAPAGTWQQTELSLR